MSTGQTILIGLLAISCGRLDSLEKLRVIVALGLETERQDLVTDA